MAQLYGLWIHQRDGSQHISHRCRSDRLRSKMQDRMFHTTYIVRHPVHISEGPWSYGYNVLTDYNLEKLWMKNIEHCNIFDM